MIYMFLADGFEEIEALCPLDLLRRAGIAVTTVGVGHKTVTGAHGIAVLADLTDAEFAAKENKETEGVILPGGMPGTLNLGASETVISALRAAHEAGLLICAICAAPSVPGELGMLAGKRAVCFPGFEGSLKGAENTSARVERDGNLITAVGMGAALEFGLAIVSALRGREAAEKLSAAVLAPAGTVIA